MKSTDQTHIRQGSSTSAGIHDMELADSSLEMTTDAGKALLIWDAARNRLEPLRRSWERASDCDYNTPDYPWCASIVHRYEQAKRLGGRIDFTDMLGCFAGWSFTIEGPELCTPDGEDLLAPGTKDRFLKGSEYRNYPHVEASQISRLGATEELAEIIKNRQWRGIVDGGHDYAEAADQYGLDIVRKPRIRIGTIHSAKGAEADNVLYLTTTSKPVARGQESDEGADAERRVEYVAVTRARKRLIVAVEPRKRNRARLPV